MQRCGRAFIFPHNATCKSKMSSSPNTEYEQDEILGYGVCYTKNTEAITFCWGEEVGYSCPETTHVHSMYGSMQEAEEALESVKEQLDAATRASLQKICKVDPSTPIRDHLEKARKQQTFEHDITRYELCTNPIVEVIEREGLGEFSQD